MIASSAFAASCWSVGVPTDPTCRFYIKNSFNEPVYQCGIPETTSPVKTDACPIEMVGVEETTGNKKVVWRCPSSNPVMQVTVKKSIDGFPTCKFSTQTSVPTTTSTTKTTATSPEGTEDTIDVGEESITAGTNAEVDPQDTRLDAHSSQIAELEKAQTRNTIGILILLVFTISSWAYTFFVKK